MSVIFISTLSIFILGLFVGALFFILYSMLTARKREQSLKTEVNMILNRAKSQAGKIERSSKQKAKEWEEQEIKRVEKEIKGERAKLKSQEYQLKKNQEKLQAEFQTKENELKKISENLRKEKEFLEVSQKQVESLKEKVKNEKEQSEKALEKITMMTKEEAKDQLKKLFEEDVKKEIFKDLLKIKEDMRKTHEQKAKLLLAQAMARYSAEVTAERTMETLPISGSFTKGKIIGREGRNIRALEATCGVDLLIGEGQEIVTISCFDPVRRTIAKKAIERLMDEGRVHPAFIEEVVEKIRKELFSEMMEEGRKICFDMGIHTASSEIIKVLGSLKYRFIEGQNLLKYSTEVAYISSLLAGELGIDKKTASRAGLFHALGLGVPHFVEGNYSFVGAQFCQKQGESEKICQAIACHDGKKPARSLLDHVLQCAYNLSRNRSGAKRDMLDSYINRLKDMESLANSFDGVKRSFAVQAGKEIRVLVDTFKVINDEQMSMLSWDIAEKIKREMKLNEEVKISVIREYRIVEHAR